MEELIVLVSKIKNAENIKLERKENINENLRF